MAIIPIDLTDDHIAERTSQRISFQATDEAGNILADSDLSTLTVTLFEESGETIINSRTDTNILGANGGSYSGGFFHWLMAPLDNQLVNGRNYEAHIALFEWTYGGGGAKQGRQPVRLMVVNLATVP